MPASTPTRERIKAEAKARSLVKQKKSSSKSKTKKQKSNEQGFNPVRFFNSLLAVSLFVGLISLGTYNLILFTAYGFDKQYLEINKCIYSKGKWDYKKNLCVK